MENLTKEEYQGWDGELFLLIDIVVGKIFGLAEYPNVRSAVRNCRGMSFPKGLEKGDFKLIHVGSRQGVKMVEIDPKVVWEYDPAAADK